MCTGNIFRSVTAEYALKAALEEPSVFSVSSAGTMDAPGYVVRNDVAAYLARKGLDVSKHARRTLTQDMLNQSDVVIPMSTDHQMILERDYGLTTRLYTEACGATPEPLLDVDDLFAPNERHSHKAQQHIYKIIDQIVDQSHLLARRLTVGD